MNNNINKNKNNSHSSSCITFIHLFSLLLGSSLLRERQRLAAVPGYPVSILVEDSRHFCDIDRVVFVNILNSGLGNLRQLDGSTTHI